MGLLICILKRTMRIDFMAFGFTRANNQKILIRFSIKIKILHVIVEGSTVIRVVVAKDCIKSVEKTLNNSYHNTDTSFPK